MLSASDIREAARNIGPHVSRTPIIHSHSLSRLCGAEIYLKCENFQKTGSFKIRGAFNRLMNCKARRVVAASMGNHAQGVAAAAEALGLGATIVMPEGVSPAKENAVRDYGAKVILKGRDLDGAIKHALSLRGAEFIHPYDDELVMAGQGTVGLEIAAELKGADCVLVPVGGGGLISGIAAYLKDEWPGTRIIGVQAGAAQSALRSFGGNRLVASPPCPSIADGIAVGRVGSLTLRAMRRSVDEMRSVGEAAIAQAVLMLLERKKLVVEGAGAVGLAALLEDPKGFKGMKVVLVLSGGNIDFTLVDRILSMGLRQSGRIGIVEAVIDDAPGALHSLTGIIAKARGNILDVYHDRLAGGVPIQRTKVRVTLEVRSRGHLEDIISSMKKKGLEIKEASDDRA